MPTSTCSCAVLAAALVASACARESLSPGTQQPTAPGTSPSAPGAGDADDGPADGSSSPTLDGGGPSSPSEMEAGGPSVRGDSGVAAMPDASEGCGGVDCAAARDVGTLIGTNAQSVEGMPDARQSLSVMGNGSDALSVEVVDFFESSDFNFSNLVGARVTFTGSPKASYEIVVTGGGAGAACGEPYAAHVLQTDADGSADITSVWGRFEGMPPLVGSTLVEHGALVVEVRQLAGPCDASWTVQLAGNPCSSNCAYNPALPCQNERTPRTCAEVTN